MITSYSDLQTEVIANSFRSDLTARIPTFIQLCEADMQRRLKLVDLEDSATVTITAGEGALPTGYAGHRVATWEGDEVKVLEYVTPDRFETLHNRVTLPTFFTVTGSTIKVMSEGDGTVNLTYNARFTPLSDTDTTNAILNTYPDAYFFGTMKQLYHYTRNWEAKAEQEKDFERVVMQIIRDHKDRKYPGPLQVRPR